MGERLTFSITASPDAQRCLIPPLAVMTLVENAIKHGIEPQIGGGRISIVAFCETGILVVEVTDNGAGFQSEMGDGIGLINLQERLHALFGTQAELSINPGQQVRCRSSLRKFTTKYYDKRGHRSLHSTCNNNPTR